MNVFVDPPMNMSQAMFRVAKALKSHAPESITFTANMRSADLCVLHVIGFPDTMKLVTDLLDAGKKIVIIQYCLRTTQQPDIKSWLPMWRWAKAVWSYYDLNETAKLEGESMEGVNFYHSPLGVDTEVFKLPPPFRRREYTILTSGYVAESETVREAALAAKNVSGQVFHLGPEMHLGSHVYCSKGMGDPTLARIYGSCQFVAGLRRVEGFELPAAEGLMCGARPIMYDQPHYRRWFHDFAEFIPEGTPDEVIASLTTVFKKGPRPVGEEERRRAVDWFDWKPIATGFWRAVNA